MQVSHETALKLRLHDRLVSVVMERNLDRHKLHRGGLRLLTREQFSRLLKGPEINPISLDRLADALRAAGEDVDFEVRISPRRARELPMRHAVPAAA